MYGSIYRCRVQSGREQAVLEMIERWHRELRPKLPEFVRDGFYRSQSHPGWYFGYVVFETKEAYERNANDPDQDRWFRDFRELLDGEVAWEDGELIQSVG